jgi:hypothetical protein
MRVLGGPSVLTESSALSGPCIAAAPSLPPSATVAALGTSGYLSRSFPWAAQRLAHQLRPNEPDRRRYYLQDTKPEPCAITTE